MSHTLVNWLCRRSFFAAAMRSDYLTVVHQLDVLLAGYIAAHRNE